MSATAPSDMRAQPRRELPGRPIPYSLADGEGRAHLLLGQVGRTLAGEEETSGTLSLMTALGPAGDPIPLHVHEREHDFFYCVRGRIQVWAGDESRILLPGDFASVPPGVAHAYRFHEHYSQFMGPIVPAGWDRFFDFCGTPYPGPAYPKIDPSPPPVEKFGAAQERFSMTYRFDLPYGELSTGPDNALPGSVAAYFLRAGEGPAHELFGQVSVPLLSGAETDGRVSMTVTEGSRPASMPAHLHEETHEALYCLEGRMRVRAAGETHELTRGDFMSIPVGVEHSYALDAYLTRFATIYAPAGLERLFELAGDLAEQRIFGETTSTPDRERLAGAVASLDLRLDR